MGEQGIARPEDFKRALERVNIERVVLPASGLPVLLCRPPVFAALAMGRSGTHLQAKVTDAQPEEIKTEDIEAFTRWLCATLTRLFVQPRFAAEPGDDEIGLADILIEDLKFIFRWLRGEIFVAPASSRQDAGATEDLGRFPGGQGAASVPGGSGKAQPLPPQRTPGNHGNAGLSAGLHGG